MAIEEFVLFPTAERMAGRWSFEFYGETKKLAPEIAANLAESYRRAAVQTSDARRVQFNDSVKAYGRVADDGGRLAEPLVVEQHELSVGEVFIHHLILHRGGYEAGGSTWQRLLTQDYYVYRDVNSSAQDYFVVHPPKSDYLSDVILFQLWREAAVAINYAANFGKKVAPGKWLVDQSLLEERGTPSDFVLLFPADHFACKLQQGPDDSVHAQTTMLDEDGRPVRQANSVWASDRLVALDISTWHALSQEIDEKRGIRVLSFQPGAVPEISFDRIASEPIMASVAEDDRTGVTVRFDPLQGPPDVGASASPERAGRPVSLADSGKSRSLSMGRLARSIDGQVAAVDEEAPGRFVASDEGGWMFWLGLAGGAFLVGLMIGRARR